jgi:hypothetical protein
MRTNEPWAIIEVETSVKGPADANLLSPPAIFLSLSASHYSWPLPSNKFY